MKLTFKILSLVLFVSCSKTSESNLPFLPPTNGNWVSVQTFGGSLEDIAHGIKTTEDGGFVIIGNTLSTDGDFNTKTRSGSDIFLMKFDPKINQI